MFVDVYDFIKCCMECVKEKLLNPRAHYWNILLQSTFHIDSIDIVGPFTESASWCKFLIVTIDELTKWVEAIPFLSISIRTTTKFILHNIILDMDTHRKF